MADLALVFHWQPASMDALPLAELIDWRERARARWEQDDGA
ncbi:GpE family phage tail protein [Ectopseudomonas khazarica]|nr:GpE family phage tail protein [Pseudomonas khazarica]QTS88865.1 GpE family phage tail protein [Pseudomonas khazarica]